MDLGIQGRRAIVCASSKGLGKACALSLAREGVAVFLNGRNEEILVQAAAEISEFAELEPSWVVADLDTASGRAKLLEACPAPDIVVTNNAGPPPGSFEDWTREAWLKALESNLLGQIDILSSVVPGMRERGFGRCVNITSAVVKSPRFGMSLSTTARAGLTAFSKGLARESARDNVTINNLLPQHIDTGRQQFMAERIMKDRGVDFDEARRLQVKAVRARRFGRPEEFGDACAFLCSDQAGYLTGQNILLDGGSYDGLM